MGLASNFRAGARTAEDQSRTLFALLHRYHAKDEPENEGYREQGNATIDKHAMHTFYRDRCISAPPPVIT